MLVARIANWDFGYTAYFPNIIIDDLKVAEGTRELPLLLDFEMKPDEYGFFYRSVRDGALACAGEICADGLPNANPYTPPSFIKVINNEKHGYKITLPRVPFFKDTELVGVELTD